MVLACKGLSRNGCERSAVAVQAQLAFFFIAATVAVAIAGAEDFGLTLFPQFGTVATAGFQFGEVCLTHILRDVFAIEHRAFEFHRQQAAFCARSDQVLKILEDQPVGTYQGLDLDRKSVV